jgi:hypothetical protein
VVTHVNVERRAPALQLHQNGSGRTMLNGSPHGTFSLPQSLTKQSIGRVAACLRFAPSADAALLLQALS